MKHFLKYTTVAIGVAFSLSTYALPNNTPITQNTNLNNQLQKQQAGNTQNATNSLILWLNNNLVSGTPLQFAQTMKGNWGNILSNANLATLTWKLTSGITFVDLKGTSPTDSTTDTDSKTVNTPPPYAKQQCHSRQGQCQCKQCGCLYCDFKHRESSGFGSQQHHGRENDRQKNTAI